MAATHALFCGWNRGVTGREAANVELFGQFSNWLKKKAEKKEIENFEPVFLAPHGGDLNGFFLIRGTDEQLFKLQQSTEWKDMNTQAGWGMENYGVTRAFLGSELEDQMARYQKLITK